MTLLAAQKYSKNATKVSLNCKKMYLKTLVSIHLKIAKNTLYFV